MANGEHCKKCGFLQTHHYYQAYKDKFNFECDGFESELVHDQKCTRSYNGVTCMGNGDCSNFNDWANLQEKYRQQHIAELFARFPNGPPDQ